MSEATFTDGRDDQGLIGQLLGGRYRLQALLGTGGMGAVYRAEHVGLRKAVAVKVVHRRLGDNEEMIARFRREALVGGQVAHPNCVPVLDFGTLGDHAFYMVMELLEGELLSDVLEREQRLPWPRALRIARHVLRGLGHAHEIGIVHRDIKPENVFITHRDDEPELARVFDFGIAKLLDAESATITQEGTTIGTPAYLSPEQAFGSPLDGRTDLYSLSIVLFEMLAGRTPFGDREPMAMLVAHATAAVPRLVDVAPGADVPPAVETLVREGLAKKPADRIASAAAYVERIDALLADLLVPPRAAVVAAQADVPTITKRRWPRVPWPLAAMIAIAFIGVVMQWIPDRTRPGPERLPIAAPVPTSTVPVPTSTAPVPDRADAQLERDIALKSLIHDLELGQSCADRRAAIPKLRALGDNRAIPALRRARYRMRGGVLGVGDKNSNACLKSAAEAAVLELQNPGAPGGVGSPS